jgi:hypothetical protein
MTKSQRIVAIGASSGVASMLLALDAPIRPVPIV